MDNYNFDLDINLFNDESTDGSYLTKVEYDKERNKIIATFHDFEHGKAVSSKACTIYNNHYNNHRVLMQKYESIFKLIEIHDKPLYEKISELQVDADYHKYEYRFKRFLSIVGAGSAVAFGYALANIDSSSDPLLIVLVISAGALLFGIHNRKQFVLNRHIYQVNCARIFDQIELSSKNYVRIKK